MNITTRRIASVMVIGWISVTAPGRAAPALVEGIDYVRLKQPHALQVAHQPEVLDFFAYICKHCGASWNAIGDWSSAHSREVHSMRVPVMWGGVQRDDAAVFARLESMGVNPRKYHLLYLNGRNEYELIKALREDGLEARYLAKGDSPRSRAARESQVAILARAQALSDQYGKDVVEVPMIVVNGRYALTAAIINDAPDQVGRRIDALLAMPANEIVRQ